MSNMEKYRSAFAVRAPEGPIEAAMTMAEGRRVPRRWVVAAVCAAALLIMGTAAVPAGYRLLTNLGIIHTERVFSVDFHDVEWPVELVDGRLMFVYGGEDLDITDLVDEETPYIYTGTNPGTGGPEYIIVGGTPERFGFAEVWIENGAVCIASRVGDQNTPAGETSSVSELTPELYCDEYILQSVADSVAPWFAAGLERLDLGRFLGEQG